MAVNARSTGNVEHTLPKFPPLGSAVPKLLMAARVECTHAEPPEAHPMGTSQTEDLQRCLESRTRIEGDQPDVRLIMMTSSNHLSRPAFAQLPFDVTCVLPARSEARARDVHDPRNATKLLQMMEHSCVEVFREHKLVDQTAHSSTRAPCPSVARCRHHRGMERGWRNQARET
mmetsp:Transcript_9057/g.28270  ORF Transcript_9057/g.28270 Transcript_9057/m.28270 type:complete len:173 (-) Transcript_9057:2-520(-)